MRTNGKHSRTNPWPVLIGVLVLVAVCVGMTGWLYQRYRDGQGSVSQPPIAVQQSSGGIHGANEAILFFREYPDTADRLYSIRPDGSAEVRYLDDSVSAQMAVFSPDGSKIVYSRAEIQNQKVVHDPWIMNQDGTGSGPLDSSLDSPEWVVSSYSPDGDNLVYHYGDLSTFQARLYQIGADGQNKTLLYDTLTPFTPFWANNGWIYFSRLKQSAGYNVDIFKIDPEENPPTAVYVGGTDGIDYAPVACGGFVFFTRYDGSQGYRINTDGTTLIPVFSGRKVLSYACSPDETSLAVSMDNHDDRYDIYLADLEGSIEYQVTDTTDKEVVTDWGVIAVPTLTPTLPPAATETPTATSTPTPLSMGVGFGLGQVTSPYVARLTNPKDFIDSTSINDLKAITHPVTHSCVAGSLATLQELADRAVSEGVTCDYLTYNLDGQWTPPEEFDNFQQSIEIARGIADAHSMRLAVGPGMQFMQEHEELYPAAAAIADAWMISAHVFQVYDIPGYKKTPAEFAADVKHVADILRAAHPDIVVWAQMAIIPGGMVQNLFSAEEMVTYAQAIEAEVEAVRIYLGQLPEAEPVFYALMDLVRPLSWCPDVDGDERVGLTDINLILNSNQWNQPYSGIDYLAEDVNRDWRIDILDINQVISYRNWNGGCGS